MDSNFSYHTKQNVYSVEGSGHRTGESLPKILGVHSHKGWEGTTTLSEPRKQFRYRRIQGGNLEDKLPRTYPGPLKINLCKRFTTNTLLQGMCWLRSRTRKMRIFVRPCDTDVSRNPTPPRTSLVLSSQIFSEILPEKSEPVTLITRLRHSPLLLLTIRNNS